MLNAASEGLHNAHSQFPMRTGSRETRNTYYQLSIMNT